MCHECERLRAALEAERQQRAFDVAEYERQMRSLIEEWIATRFELARYRALDVAAPPSELRH